MNLFVYADLANFFNYYPLDVVRDTDTFKTFYNAASNDVTMYPLTYKHV